MPSGVSGDKRKRPEPDSTTVREMRWKICAHCGYMIDEAGSCTYDCPFDYEDRGPKDYFTAVYERTDKFLYDVWPAGRESGK